MTIRPPQPPSNVEAAYRKIGPELARMVYDMRDQIPMFTIYDHPLDHPDYVVARLWVTLPRAMPCDFTVMTPNIETMQMLMMRVGLHRLERSAEDDPAIMETWL